MSQKIFSANSTALEVIEGHDLTGYETIVTGGSSGIGVETARALAKAGARVVIAARDLKKAGEVAQDIRKTTGNDKVEVEKLDLDSLASCKDFAKRYLAKGRPLHILINNAGIMACPKTYTVDGFESQFGTNHMGHFALTVGLLPALKEGAKKSGKNARVVSVASLAHAMGPSDIDFEDINYKKRDYDPWGAYGQSKMANILFSVALTKLYSHEGIYSNSLMPGGIMTNLQKHMSEEEKIKLGLIDKDGKPNPWFKSIEQGASTTIWAAVGSELENVGGKYLEDCQFSQPASKEDINKTYKGYLAQAVDEASAMKLWNLSKEWLENPPK